MPVDKPQDPPIRVALNRVRCCPFNCLISSGLRGPRTGLVKLSLQMPLKKSQQPVMRYHLRNRSYRCLLFISRTPDLHRINEVQYNSHEKVNATHIFPAGHMRATRTSTTCSMRVTILDPTGYILHARGKSTPVQPTEALVL